MSSARIASRQIDSHRNQSTEPQPEWLLRYGIALQSAMRWMSGGDLQLETLHAIPAQSAPPAMFRTGDGAAIDDEVHVNVWRIR